MRRAWVGLWVVTACSSGPSGPAEPAPTVQPVVRAAVTPQGAEPPKMAAGSSSPKPGAAPNANPFEDPEVTDDDAPAPPLAPSAPFRSGGELHGDAAPLPPQSAVPAPSSEPGAPPKRPRPTPL